MRENDFFGYRWERIIDEGNKLFIFYYKRNTLFK